MAWKFLSRPCLAVPPAESPSTRNTSHFAGSVSEQSESFPGRPPPPITVFAAPFHELFWQRDVPEPQGLLSEQLFWHHSGFLPNNFQAFPKPLEKLVLRPLCFLIWFWSALQTEVLVL